MVTAAEAQKMLNEFMEFSGASELGGSGYPDSLFRPS